MRFCQSESFCQMVPPLYRDFTETVSHVVARICCDRKNMCDLSW
jgi:hypothetical protein